ncbi:hypothetical protein LINGRAHAP2_LOCUS9682 [Linum grandiflorum]
MFEFRHR